MFIIISFKEFISIVLFWESTHYKYDSISLFNENDSEILQVLLKFPHVILNKFIFYRKIILIHQGSLVTIVSFLWIIFL